MEAILLTIAIVGLAALGYVVASRSWPRSSGLGGYRARLRGDRDGASDGETAPGVREDDDAHWNWSDDEPEERGPSA